MALLPEGIEASLTLHLDEYLRITGEVWGKVAELATESGYYLEDGSYQPTLPMDEED